MLAVLGEYPSASAIRRADCCSPQRITIPPVRSCAAPITTLAARRWSSFPIPSARVSSGSSFQRRSSARKRGGLVPTHGLRRGRQSFPVIDRISTAQGVKRADRVLLHPPQSCVCAACSTASRSVARSSSARFHAGCDTASAIPRSVGSRTAQSACPARSDRHSSARARRCGGSVSTTRPPSAPPMPPACRLTPAFGSSRLVARTCVRHENDELSIRTSRRPMETGCRHAEQMGIQWPHARERRPGRGEACFAPPIVASLIASAITNADEQSRGHVHETPRASGIAPTTVALLTDRAFCPAP